MQQSSLTSFSLHSRLTSNLAQRRASRQDGFSLIELLIVVAIIMIIAGIAIPKMNNAMMGAREMSAVREIGTIHSAQTQYYSQFQRFAKNLAELGPPASGAPGPAAADLIPASLASGKKSGHVYVLAATPTGYAVSVVPEAFGTSGRRTFYSDQTLVVRQNWSQEPATAQSPEMQ
ncbi:MAG: prepilin-type N-terminal cleavage/methylation domain-containing protein [Acidobacteriota bacterium]